MPEAVYTLPGTKLPEGDVPPTLLFHRWQSYDRFVQEGQLKAFKRDVSGHDFLKRVAAEAQNACKANYGGWHQRFTVACAAVGAEPALPATTLWRLVIGWGTNPTFETGLTLDHLLGFPYIPGSAVKGLLHRVAEHELLEEVGGEPAIPEAPPNLPPAVPAELEKALARSLRVRALFGSIHLRRSGKFETDPEAPFDRLSAWLGLIPPPPRSSDPWNVVRERLARLCSEAPAGGMVTCFDAVPASDAFVKNPKDLLLTPDVLTPHVGKSPNPIPFLAVRDRVSFELRYRLAAQPSAEPRDDEERERAANLCGLDRDAIAAMLRRWLFRGLAELGVGGKTSSGYGYLHAEGQPPSMPELLEEPSLPESEKFARRHLPGGATDSAAATAIEVALRDHDPENRAAVARRFGELHPGILDKWRKSPKGMKRERAAEIERLAQQGDGDRR